MKKWKQLVVFVMILTMVMGMTSFAAPGDASRNTRTTSGPSLSGGSISGNTIVKENPTIPSTPENEKLGLTVTDLHPAQKEALAESLATTLGTLKRDEKFGNETGDKLVVFDLKAPKHDGKTAVVVSIDCKKLIEGLSGITSKDNFRVLHHNGKEWESLPTVGFANNILQIEFKSFSPVCIVASSKAANNPAKPDNNKPTDPDNNKPTDPDNNKPTDPDDNKPTDPDDNKPTDPDDNKPTDPDDSKPVDPTITSDKWKLTYSLVANKYNTFVLRWEAAEAGRYEVWYSATPEDSNSFKRLTTTKKTTYKFTKAVLDVRYGFKIRVKGSDKFSETLYITNKMDGRVTATTVSVINKSYNSLQVKWDKIPGVKKYAIYRDGVKIAEKSGTKMTDKGLVTGRDYTYTVQPISMKGAKGTFAGPVSAPVTNAPKMKGISSINVKAVDSATLRITWSKVKGANYYTVCEVVTVDGKEVLEPVAENVTTNRCTVINLLAGSEHTYRVIAHAGNGHSVISKAKTARTKIVK